ncbi:MAG: hypothetical protein H0X36_03060 [Sphingomonadaceae bacterium]|nr:hypothetical protein [Sphingomonadaceae bacterium]
MTDASIARLFERRKRAKRALDAAEAAIRAARAAYAAKHGLLAFPSMDAMRRGCQTQAAA